ncbi:hypothetical protein glysoja_008871 [Glycine soja]|nr:hypothetical protein glysoja_008871 [Glycine soja]
MINYLGANISCYCNSVHRFLILFTKTIIVPRLGAL